MPLSQLIDVVNGRFGTDFNQADQFFFDQVVERAEAMGAITTLTPAVLRPVP